MSVHEHHETAPEDRLSKGQMFSYGLGSIVNNLLGGAIGFMSIVLNVGLGINPALVGALQAIPRFTDALTDPVMGYVSDNTRSRFGRRRPYIFIGAIGVGVIFALMWQLPSGHSEMFYFWVFLAGSIVFYLFYTVFATPWVALGYELTPDYHERTRLMAVMNFMGQFAWISLPWFYAIMENDRLFSNSVHGARVLAIVIGIFVAIVGVMPAIFCRERFVPPEGEKKQKTHERDASYNLVLTRKVECEKKKRREIELPQVLEILHGIDIDHGSGAQCALQNDTRGGQERTDPGEEQHEGGGAGGRAALPDAQDRQT